jgi:hypothetical protein
MCGLCKPPACGSEPLPIISGLWDDASRSMRTGAVASTARPQTRPRRQGEYRLLAPQAGNFLWRPIWRLKREILSRFQRRILPTGPSSNLLVRQLVPRFSREISLSEIIAEVPAVRPTKIEHERPERARSGAWWRLLRRKFSVWQFDGPVRCGRDYDASSRMVRMYVTPNIVR